MRKPAEPSPRKTTDILSMYKQQPVDFLKPGARKADN